MASVLSPDFYKMGYTTAMIFKDSLLEESWNPSITLSDSLFSINIKRLEELGFIWVYNKIIEEVDGSYAVY